MVAKLRDHMPMYEQRYCRPASIDDAYEYRKRRYQGVGVRIASRTHDDIELESIRTNVTEYAGVANESIERDGDDLAMAVWVELGRRKLTWACRTSFRGGHLYLVVDLDRRRIPHDDFWYRVEIDEQQLDDREYAVSGPGGPIERGGTGALLRWRARGNDVAVDNMHLAMEFGVGDVHPARPEGGRQYWWSGLGEFMTSDDPRELRCDERGHVDEPDRWEHAEW